MTEASYPAADDATEVPISRTLHLMQSVRRSSAATEAASTEISGEEPNGLSSGKSQDAWRPTLYTPVVARMREDRRQGRPLGRLCEVGIESGTRRSLFVLFLAEPGQRHKKDLGAENLTNPLTGLVSARLNVSAVTRLEILSITA